MPYVSAQTPSQQSSVLDNGQEELSGSGPWNPYPLGRRDVPPNTVTKKVSGTGQSSSSVPAQHCQGSGGTALGNACFVSKFKAIIAVN